MSIQRNPLRRSCEKTVHPGLLWVYDKSIPADQHPANKDVMIRIMSTAGGARRTLAKLFGGQGTMNVPLWSPDSSEISFVSYRLLESN
ncbi:MAG: hypothetical protein WCK15_07625 [Pirellula sp.]